MRKPKEKKEKKYVPRTRKLQLRSGDVILDVEVENLIGGWSWQSELHKPLFSVAQSCNVPSLVQLKDSKKEWASKMRTKRAYFLKVQRAGQLSLPEA